MPPFDWTLPHSATVYSPPYLVPISNNTMDVIPVAIVRNNILLPVIMSINKPSGITYIPYFHELWFVWDVRLSLGTVVIV